MDAKEGDPKGKYGNVTGRPKNTVVAKHLEEKGKKFDSADWAMQQSGLPQPPEQEKKP